MRERSPRTCEGLAEARDIAEIAHLHAANFATTWPDAYWRGHLANASTGDETGRLFVSRCVATEDSAGPLAGFILARRIIDEAEILAIAVDRSYRRQGIARRLIDCLAADMRRDLPCRLFLEVSVENAAALALYCASGFIEIGTRKQYYAMPGRTPVDAKILARDLAR